MFERLLLTIILTALVAVIFSACTQIINPSVIPMTVPVSTLEATPSQIVSRDTPAQVVEIQGTSEPASETLSVDLDSMLQRETEYKVFSGSVLIARDGKIILAKGYGFADRENNIPNTAQTRIPICSITKQFTAMAILILQEQGKLDVNDSICGYLKNCPDIWRSITIHQLLSHTSGLPDPLEDFWTRDITSPIPLEMLIADAKSKLLISQPGEKFSYNNTGYILLGKIIESASGQTYGTFLQKNIFQPLGMTDTGFDPNPKELAIGYKDKTGTVADPFNLWVAFSAGALYSTVDDLYLWDQALYTNQLVPQKALETMFTAQALIPDANGVGYGYGWVTGSDNHGQFVAHEGSAYGYRTLIIRYPNERTTLIILINQEDIDPNAAASLITKKLFGEQ